MTYPHPIPQLLRVVVVALLIVALPLASLAAIPAADPDCCCACEGGDAQPVSGCGAGEDGTCPCPSCQDALSTGDPDAAFPLPLAGVHSPDNVRIPRIGTPSGIFRPPLA